MILTTPLPKTLIDQAPKADSTTAKKLLTGPKTTRSSRRIMTTARNLRRLPTVVLPILAAVLLAAGCAGDPPRAADTCESALDGECDEPQYCAEGTDTTDCGDDSCASANDGECDEPQYCDFGTDTTDCRAARLCEPQCGAQVCGIDPVCGSSCGACSGNQTCNSDGQCIDDSCTADCSGRTCGADPVCGESCGTCGGAEVCDGSTGQCASPCEAGRTLCDGTCVDTSSDPAHCGGCSACPTGNLCENGSCVQPPEDCRQEPCSGFSYCDLGTGQCLPGCASTEQCGANEVCDLAAHTCDCISNHVRCNGSCVEDDDLPDLNYEDANCDGVDGNAANAIFVAPGGNDNNTGTMAQPLATIQAGMLAAEGRPRAEVFIGAGLYDLTESLLLRDNVSLYGGYDASNGWMRSASSVTEIRGPSPVLDGTNQLDGPLAIQGLKIVGIAGSLAPGESAYGILVRAGSGTLFIQGNEIVPGPGASGAPGVDGTPGNSGEPGGNGRNGRTGAGGTSCGQGGGGGTSYSTGGSSEANGRPGQPGQPTGRGGSRGLGGNGCSSNKHGDPGGDGMPGTAGTPGPVVTDLMGSVESNRFLQSGGTDGGRGETGGGGGGGGGGSYCRTNGGGGGGGGSGGCGGGGGEGGIGGGGSFCVFVVGGAVETGQNRFMPSAGGTGGDGGDGAIGGTPANGGNGGSGATSGANRSGSGGMGGTGAMGGTGGPGSGGPGGPSVGVYISNGAHNPTNDQIIDPQGGAGGAGGSGAPGGPAGSTYSVYCESGSCTTVVN